MFQHDKLKMNNLSQLCKNTIYNKLIYNYKNGNEFIKWHFQIPSSSSLDSIKELKDILSESKMLRNIAKTENLTRELLLEWGLSEAEADVALEEFVDSRNAYEVWKIRFKTAFLQLNATDRIDFGHDAGIFLHTAKTAGMICGKLLVLKYPPLQLSLF